MSSKFTTKLLFCHRIVYVIQATV